jgi:hypothetical protein
MGKKKTLTEDNKKKKPKIKILAYELLASTLSYLMLAPWWYTNPSNPSSRTPPMSSLIVLCFSSHYRIVLLPHYESVSPPASVQYVQTISNDVARASTRLGPPQVSHVYHHSGPDLFLCCHKIHRSMRISATLSCWTCRLLVGQHSAPYNMADRITIL